MRLQLVELDDRVSKVREAEAKADDNIRRRFEEQLKESWIFHDLQVEGIALYEEDIERALRGDEGNDYCDGVLLDQIRNYNHALGAMIKAAREEKKPTLDTMFTYQHTIEPEATEDPIRSDEGASDNYKHDVANPDVAMDMAKEAIKKLQSDKADFHPVQTAIEIHYELLQAWPLARWNALVTRMITNQHLMRRGYPPIIVTAHQRQDYYHALNYDIRRLQSLLLQCFEQHIALRERHFNIE